MNNSGASYAVRAIISSVLVIGLIVGIVAYGNYVINNDNDSNSSYVGGHYNNSANDYIMGGDYNEKVELTEDAHSYKISISAGNAEVLTTTGTPYVTLESEYKMRIDTRFSNGTYDIRFNRLNSGLRGWFYNFNSPIIKIYLPADKKLDNMDISVSAGELFVRDLEITKLKTTVSAGELIIEKCEVDELDSKVTAGDFDFYANKDIKKIDSRVTAGEMTINLPKDIPGFTLYYNATAGEISNDTHFGLGEFSDGINKSGNTIYGDGSCDIDLNVTAGDIVLEDY